MKGLLVIRVFMVLTDIKIQDESMELLVNVPAKKDVCRCGYMYSFYSSEPSAFYMLIFVLRSFILLPFWQLLLNYSPRLIWLKNECMHVFTKVSHKKYKSGKREKTCQLENKDFFIRVEKGERKYDIRYFCILGIFKVIFPWIVVLSCE